MKNTKKIILGIAAAAAFSAAAQEAPRSAYFMDGYSFRHELNPAFMGEYNYFSFPALGNLNVGFGANVGLDNFIFKNPDTNSRYGLTTFLNPSISADQFLNGLDDLSKLDANVDLTLLSAGFRGFGGFNTVTVGFHTGMGVYLPKDLFKFMKVGYGNGNDSYNFKDMRVNASSFAEIGIGHSHAIGERLTVGATVKCLVGLADLTMHVTNMNVQLGADKWLVDAQGSLDFSAPLSIPTYAESGNEMDRPTDTDVLDWKGIDIAGGIKPSIGFAADFGATYRLLDNLELSAAVRDLGSINWINATKASMGGKWLFEGFQNVGFTDPEPGQPDNSVDTQLENLTDDLAQLAKFRRTETGSSYSRKLNATIHLGAEYTMPFYSGLSVGALGTQYTAGPLSWTEGRVFANLKPASWIDANVNYGINTFGSSMGWMLNFHPRGINIFLGTDHQFFRITPIGIPVGKLNTSVNLGVNFTWGAKKMAKK